MHYNITSRFIGAYKRGGYVYIYIYCGIYQLLRKKLFLWIVDGSDDEIQACSTWFAEMEL